MINVRQSLLVAPHPPANRTIAIKETQGFVESGVVNAVDSDRIVAASRTIIPEGRDSAYTLGRSDVVFSKTHQSQDHLTRVRRPWSQC